MECVKLLWIFSGDNQISGEITFDPALIDLIRKYKGCNRLIFGVKSDKQPAPIDVKKLVLILVTARILGHCAVVEKNQTDGLNDIVSVKIKATLAQSITSNAANNDGGVVSFALFDDYYWYRIRVREALI